MDPEGMVCLLNYREDGITPYFTFFKDGVKEQKLVSIFVSSLGGIQIYLTLCFSSIVNGLCMDTYYHIHPSNWASSYLLIKEKSPFGPLFVTL